MRYPLLCTFNLDEDQVRAVCRVLRQEQTRLMADGCTEEAAPFAQVAHELVEAHEVCKQKMTEEAS